MGLDLHGDLANLELRVYPLLPASPLFLYNYILEELNILYNPGTNKLITSPEVTGRQRKKKVKSTFSFFKITQKRLLLEKKYIGSKLK